MKLEEYKNYIDKNIMSIMSKSNEEERDLLNVMIKIINQLCEKEQELIDYLKEEQLFYYNQYKCSKKLEDLKRYNRLINEYDKILSKIERSKK